MSHPVHLLPRVAWFAEMHWQRRAACLLLVVGGSHTAFAEAPDALVDRVFRENRVTFGVSIQNEHVSVYNGDGTFTGLFARINLDERLVEPVDGTYTYTKTGSDTATLVRTFVGGDTVTETMTFATANTGEVRGSNSSDGGPFVLNSATDVPVLVNTSQRAWVSANRSAIVGFVVPPGRTSLVLVRAVGPGLAAFPGTTPAGDPRLEVYRGSDLIGANDNWESDDQAPALPGQKANILALATYTGAFPLEANSKDAAIPLLLGPGNYTVHMIVPAGAPDAEVLGEVYLVP